MKSKSKTPPSKKARKPSKPLQAPPKPTTEVATSFRRAVKPVVTGDYALRLHALRLHGLQAVVTTFKLDGVEVLFGAATVTELNKFLESMRLRDTPAYHPEAFQGIFMLNHPEAKEAK